jgi:spermidine/putrescine transport system permease protein
MGITPITVLLAFCALPICVSVYQSFVVWDGLQPVSWGGLQGYRDVLSAHRLVFIRELIIRAFLVASIDVLLAVPLADFILRIKSKNWRWLFLLSLNIPFLVSGVTRSFGWFHILNQNGFLNYLWHIPFPNAGPVASILFSRTAVIVALIGSTFPFAVFPIVLTLPNSESSFWTASEELGTGRITRIARLVIPLASSGILIGWFSVFWLSFGSSVEASVLDGPIEISLGKITSELLSANAFAAVYALSSILIVAFFGLALLWVALSCVNRFAGRLEPGRVFTFLTKLPVFDLPRRKMNTNSRIGSLLERILVGAFLLLFLFAPVWVVLVLSLSQHIPSADSFVKGLTLEWYVRAFRGDAVKEALANSLTISVCVATVSAISAFFLGMTWWTRAWRRMVIVTLALLALIPADVYALGLLQIHKSLGFKGASLLWVGFAQVAWCLPFSTAAVFASNNTLDSRLFQVGREMHASWWLLARKVLLGITWPGLASAAIIGFLLSVNEYTRASYLSGSRQILTQYLYGQMRSGADPSVYAIGAGAILVVLLLFGLLLLLLRSVSRTVENI